MAPPPTNQWDAHKMFEFYLHDYMMKKGLHGVAEIFKNEAQILDKPVFINDSPDGFLHEWWSIFYEVFASKQEKYQETGIGSSTKVPMATDNAMNNIYPVIPQVSMNEQQTPQEHLGYLHDFIENSPVLFSENNSNHQLQDVGNQTQKESLIGMQVESDISNDLMHVMENTMLHLTGSHETEIDEALNLIPLHGWPINNQVQTLPFQSSNQDIVAQATVCIPQNQTFNILEDLSNCTTLNIFEAESSDKLKQDWQGKSIHEEVEYSLSFEHVDHEVLPFYNLGQNSTSYKNQSEGFPLEEIGCLHLSKSTVLCSHFSSNGKVLAGARRDKKVFIWNMETFDCVATAEKHSLLITDVRFRPDSTIFATSSLDKSVRLWDATKPNRSYLRLTGHIEKVMSLDFHPRTMDLLCSCDNNDVIRLWDMNQCVCTHIIKGGGKQVRFQSFLGKFLATTSGNNIKIFDVETDCHVYNLKGHVKDVISICWDKTGNYIASVSEDSARVWSLDGKCISELYSNDNNFQSCIFHPNYLNHLIIGGYQYLEIWNPAENKTWSIPAHKELIVGLADSSEGELVASASDDHCVKIWK